MGDPETLSKGEFARLIGVTPGRISQMISEGKIDADALEGQGPRARIRTAIAKHQISLRTDAGQRFGNGSNTRLELDLAPAPPQGLSHEPRSPPAKPLDTFEAQIKQERLRDLRFRNQEAAEAELARRGVYIRADGAAAAMAKVAGQMLTAFEASLPELADAMAADHKLDRRAALHTIRAHWRMARVKAADAARREAGTLQAFLAEQVADATDPELGEA